MDSVKESRTDATFSARVHAEHHSLAHSLTDSVLERAGFGMVSQFPLDAMHLMDLGLGKLIVSSIVKKNVISAPRSNEAIKTLSDLHASYSSFTAPDFSR